MNDVSRATNTGCAHCGGVRLSWRVKRVRNAANTHSQRTLVWTCQGCGRESEESLAGSPGSGGHRPPGPAAEVPRAETPERGR